MKKNIKIITFIIFLFFITVLLLSFLKNCYWMQEDNKINKLIKQNKEKITINKSDYDSDIELVNSEYNKKRATKNNKRNKNKNEVQEDPYNELIKKDLVDINIKKLKKINNDTFGWIKIENSNINYPIVKNKNGFYLNHSYDKKNNKLGWIYLNKNSNENNIIICAFSGISSDMNKNINYLLYNGWLSNKNNYSINLSTEKDNSIWQIYSMYLTKNKNCNNINFNSNKKLLEKSKYKFNTSVRKDDKILTFISQFNDSEMIVIHAKLIKKQKK